MTLDRLEKTKVRCLREHEQEHHKSPAYQCIYSELDYKENSCLISSGKWYRINQAFVEEVNNFYASGDRYDGNLPIYNDDNEAAYNMRVATEGNGTIALMDQEIIQYGGGPGKVEFFDFFTENLDIIHVKRYSHSSGLSHLFAQGTVSGELFRLQSTFRGLVNNRLPDSHKLEDHERELE